ncbi:hypothetical protein C6I20_02805 [Aeromicrobium sp. A1-2]|uniref:helix-turn-helix domain-containing protein n=1 Tax=Aeromicrobium sp. A1-2 TaxID=2107713 RepID=UPI000E4CC017|nr:hypothetical protein C6I20_02805 [Aeromicrobium sp. A1-2]
MENESSPSVRGPGAEARLRWQIALELVGARVKLERERKQWSARELARRTGLSQPVISRLESATGEAKLTSVLLVAEALGISPSVLIDDLPGHPQ